MRTNLFEHEHIGLAPINPDADAQVEAGWTHDASYLRALGVDPVRPQTVAQVKKGYEVVEKAMDEGGRTYHFQIHTREDGRLVGFIRLEWIEWANGNGWLKMGIGQPQDRGRGYGSQALELVLHYAFEELGLHRITIGVPGYNAGALRFFQRHGFYIEVRQRQALERDLRRWDMNLLGVLSAGWREVAP